MRIFWNAISRLYNNSGISMASAVAFSFVLSVFPFFVFVAAIAGFLGGSEHILEAITQAFIILPPEVRNFLVPEIQNAINTNSTGLLTFGGLSMLFFASAGIEALRSALNRAYRDTEDRGFIRRRIQSVLFVFESAFVMIALGCTILFAPLIAEKISPLFHAVISDSWLIQAVSYVLALIVLICQLFAFHAWLPAGNRTFKQLWPGIFISVTLWVICAAGFSFYVNYGGYEELYVGLSQIIIALIFFHFSSILIIFGAEFNRALMKRN